MVRSCDDLGGACTMGPKPLKPSNNSQVTKSITSTNTLQLVTSAQIWEYGTQRWGINLKLFFLTKLNREKNKKQHILATIYGTNK